MLTQQQQETTTATRSGATQSGATQSDATRSDATQSDATQPQHASLGDAVKEAVESYIREMGDQPLTELYDLVLSEIEAPLLTCVLRHTDNNQSRSAAILGLNRGTLRKKLKKYDML